MKIALVLLPILLYGCSATPEQVAAQSDYEVCRLTTVPVHANVAEQVRLRRGIDCVPYYPVIRARLEAQNAAINNMRAAIQPAPQQAYQVPINRPMNCNSYRVGNSVQTQCF
jgi:hypothetical protein